MPNIDILTARSMTSRELPRNFFEFLQGPSVYNFFSQYELDYLKDIILNNKNDVKLNMMNALMTSKGFSRFAAGTNRVIYRYLDDPSFLMKVALDRVGLQDSLREFENQRILKPFVTKIFNVSPDGLMATTERCIPITRKEEFEEVIEPVFYTIVSIIGEYVMEDIGKGFFRNWCIRPSFGPVLCDFPYLYRVDESKLFCNKVDMATHIRCSGQIDYDAGFNYLICTKCGKRYLAAELEDKSPSNKIITTRFGGKYPVKISITMPDGTIYNSGASSRTVKRPRKTYEGPNRVKIAVTGINTEPKTEEVNPSLVVSENDQLSIADMPETDNQVKVEKAGEADTITATVQINASDTARFVEEAKVIASKAEKSEVVEETIEAKDDPNPDEALSKEEEVVSKGPEIKKSTGLKISSGFIKSGSEGEY